MASVVNIDNITDSTWINVNTAASITVGTAMTIQNTGVTWLRLQESTTTPTTLTEGKLLTNLDKFSSEASIPAGSDTIWVLSTVEDRLGTIAVQEA